MAVDFISLLVCRMRIGESSSSHIDFCHTLRQFVITCSIDVHIQLSRSLLNLPNDMGICLWGG